MVKINIIKRTIVNQEEFSLPKVVLNVPYIPSPNDKILTEIISVDRANYYTSFILYMPKIYEDEKGSCFIAFVREFNSENTESVYGLIDTSECPLIKIHPHCSNDRFPVNDTINFHINLPRIPSTQREYIKLFNEVFRVDRVIYSEDEITCRVLKLSEGEMLNFNDALEVYGSNIGA